MKKSFSAVIIVMGLLITANHSQAQSKIGYMSVDQMVSLMPEVPKIDSQLQKFRDDSLNATLQTLLQEYAYKDSILTKTDTSKTPKSVLNQMKTDVNVLQYQISNFQALSQQALENKQQELYAPLYSRVITALRQVAKEKGYTYVLSKDSFLVAPDGDDLLLAVAAKLGVKVNLNTQPNQPNKQPKTNH